MTENEQVAGPTTATGHELPPSADETPHEQAAVNEQAAVPEQPEPADVTRPAVDRITAAAAAAEAVGHLPLAEHAERYQQLHAALQAELGGIAHL